MKDSTFKEDDVELLLKRVDSKALLDNNTFKLQKHYCDYIPDENLHSEEYIEIFEELLNLKSKNMAINIGILSHQILLKYKNVVLISLLRAGTVVGVLIRKYIKFVFNIDVEHYSVGMSRGKGLDFNALNHILENYPNCTPIFIDGWIGKGTTKYELDKSCQAFNEKYGKNIKPVFAAISDITGSSDICSTYDDILIPTSLLNSQGCGLISRITQNPIFISDNEYNGAFIFDKLKKQDKTNKIIDSISKFFELCEDEIKNNNYLSYNSNIDINSILKKYSIHNPNGLKVGINETIRILLKKRVDFVVIRNINKIEMKPIIYLCKKNNIMIKIDNSLPCCALAVILESEGDE